MLPDLGEHDSSVGKPRRAATLVFSQLLKCLDQAT